MITKAEFKSYIGETTTDYDALIDTLIASTSAMVERYCQRTFASANYREVHGSKDIQLRQYPVTLVSRVGIGVKDALTLRNTSTDAYAATVLVTDTTIQLVVLGGDNASDETLTLSDYDTMLELKTAAEALNKGWSITTSDTWPASELYPTGISISALAGVNLFRPDEFSYSYQLDTSAGIISLPMDTMSVVSYTAGYATIPDDLKQIVIDAVKIAFDGRSKDSTLQSQKIGDYAYTTSKDTGALPDTILSRLSAWRKYV